MPRIQLIARDRYDHRTTIVVRTTDLNYGGHLGYDRLLSLVHEARIAFLGFHGFSEFDCGGASLIMADVAVAYHAESFAGNELLFESAAGEFGRLGFRLFHRVTRPADDTLIALVETGMVTFNYESHRPTSLPAALRAALEPAHDA